MSIKTYSSNEWNQYLFNNWTNLTADGKGIQSLNGIEAFGELLIHISLNINYLTNILQMKSLFNLKTLSLNGNKLQDIQSIQYLKQLEELNLSTNQISNIDPLASLVNIEILNLARNKITSILKLSNLFKLKYLNLIRNKLEHFFLDNSLIHLETLLLEGNNIHSFNLVTCPNLIYLDLSYNRIVDIQSVSNLSKLKRIIMDDNQIENINVLNRLYNLEIISAFKNEIKMVDFESEILDKLIKLNLDYNKIESLSINTPNLKELFLENNKLNHLPESVCKWRQLELVYLNKNNLQNLDCLIFSSKLHKMEVNDNQISNVDVLINNLPNLKEIELNNNKIKQVNFKNDHYILVRLDLANNQIDNIDLSKLINLKRLDISFNRIKNIDSLRNLVELTRIEAQNNEIEDISVLESLKNLIILSFSNNKIKSIESIKNLNKLLIINFNQNEIADLNPLNKLNNLLILLFNNNRINLLADSFLNRSNRIRSIDLSNNLLESNIKLSYSYLDTLILRSNHIENIMIENKTQIKFLDISDNKIRNITNTLNMNGLIKLNMSYNQIEYGEIANRIDNLIEIGFIDKESIKFYEKVRNERVVRRVGNSLFLKAYFVLIQSDLNFLSCTTQFELLKRNIHLNLFYSFQIDRFFNSCKLSDLYKLNVFKY